jgi:hypothetical protein
VIAEATRLAQAEGELVPRSVALVYERVPEAADYGPEGRVRCEEDMRFHLRFLVSAVSIEDEAVFTDYALWAAALLARYGLPAAHLAASFGALGDAIAELLDGAAAASAAPYLRAGARALG